MIVNYFSVTEDMVDSAGDGMISAKSWHGSDRDYTYDEVMERVA